ncbi:MAG: isochorismatase [Paenibacillaceae bacterium]|jgi:nicotinamidase-related amidase|nr:isochorismatase [Paenibacillaceae bacterium]
MDMKIALLIVDMQLAYLGDCVKESGAEDACEYINYVSERLRAKGHCIVHVRHLSPGQSKDDLACEIIPQVNIGQDDHTVWKNFNNAFWQTELEELLRKEKVDLVIVSGFSAEYCVTFTYGGGTERGFKTVMLQKGIVSKNPSVVPEVTRDRNMISYPAIDAILEAQ